MGGLCPPGKLPDGVACTYTYNILGFLPLDDLVGITSMVNKATGSPYANFSEFCGAGNVEFAAYDRFGYVFKTLPFWEFPLDPEANARRTQQMIAAYQKLASPDGSSSQIYFRLREKMQPLPMIDELTAQNPPCYETVRECGSTAEFGCKRETYAQICRLCTTEAKGCVKVPPTFGFPVLERPKSTASSERSEEEKASPMLQSGVGRVLPHTLILLVFWCQFIY